MIELFGLTGTEAAFADDLLARMEPWEIAKRHNRGIDIVRTRLGRLMARTDVNRQSELMRLLASLPRIRDPISRFPPVTTLRNARATRNNIA